MNQRLHTLLFVLLSVIWNLAIMALIFFSLIWVFARFISPEVGGAVAHSLLLVALLAAIGGALFLYYRLLLYLRSKPVFKPWVAPFLQ